MVLLVPKAQEDLEVQREPLELQGGPDPRVLMVFREGLDQLVLRVHKERLGPRVRLVVQGLEGQPA